MQNTLIVLVPFTPTPFTDDHALTVPALPACAHIEGGRFIREVVMTFAT